VKRKKDTALDRIQPHLDLTAAIENADLVIEAVPEQFELKKKLFEKVDQHAPAHAILASNTSSISITKLAAVTSRPEKFIGMHFFNPVPVMKLVEVINGLKTDKYITETVISVSKKLDKVPVSVNDSPGFVSNRVLMPMINEAIFCVYEGVAEPESSR
jgi:3-hydroxybutyryl-CoA dehydrogenase